MADNSKAERRLVYKLIRDNAKKRTEAKKELTQLENETEMLVKKHQELRDEAIISRIKAAGMTWCTFCKKIVPEGETNLVYVFYEVSRFYSYENEIGVSRYREIHRLCTKCHHDKDWQRHRVVNLRIRAIYPAKIEGGKFIVERNGVWVIVRKVSQYLDTLPFNENYECPPDFDVRPIIRLNNAYERKAMIVR